MIEEVVSVGNTDTTIFEKIKYHSYLFIKRLFDLICGLLGCLLLLPVALIVKISYILTRDYDKVILVQKRIGLNGKEFNFYKFRSMVPNADEVLYKLLKENKEIAKEYKKNKKLKDDPRITKMGKILRRTSLDELPQLFNVLKGDMSLIGNRPYLPREREDIGEYYDDIVKSKPGLTGYWQVSGKEDASFQRRLILEQYYSNNMSLKLDIKIFFKTFKAVIGGHGADE